MSLILYSEWFSLEPFVYQPEGYLKVETDLIGCDCKEYGKNWNTIGITCTELFRKLQNI